MSTNTALLIAGKIPKDYDLSIYQVFIPLSLEGYSECEKYSLDITVPEDLFPRGEYDDLISTFNLKLLELIQKLDKENEAQSYGSDLYSLSGFWFFHRLQTLFYIDTLCKRITESFNKVHLVSSFSPKSSMDLDFKWSTRNLNIFGPGNQQFINVLSQTLHTALENFSLILSSEKQALSTGLGSPLHILINRSPEIILRRLSGYIKKIPHFFKVKKGTVWKLQEGYEVKVLETEFNHIIFKNPIDQIDFEARKVISNSGFDDIIHSFANSSFSYNQENVLSFFRRYQETCVSSATQIKTKIIELFQNERPSGLLYALGSSCFIEGLFAQAANEIGIPVHYFKHTGIENLFLKESHLDAFFEKSTFISRNQYTHSIAEEDEIAFNKNIKAYTIFPLESFFERTLNTEKAILYSLGPSSTWSLKDLHKITLDSERITFINELINYCKNSFVPLHIKVHPADWENSYRYFSQMINDHKVPIKLIAGGSIERIIDQYEVVALDLISTKVLNSCLLAGKKTLLFKPKGIKTSEKYFPYLRKRVEVVENIKDLSKTLNVLFEKDYDINTKVEEFNQKFYGPRNREETLELIWKNLNSSN